MHAMRGGRCAGRLAMCGTAARQVLQHPWPSIQQAAAAAANAHQELHSSRWVLGVKPTNALKCGDMLTNTHNMHTNAAVLQTHAMCHQATASLPASAVHPNLANLNLLP